MDRMRSKVLDAAAAGADGTLAIQAEGARGRRCADNYGSGLVRQGEVRHSDKQFTRDARVNAKCRHGVNNKLLRQL